jgi:hypothetical protein
MCTDEGANVLLFPCDKLFHRAPRGVWGCDLFAAVYKFADGHSPQAIYCLALKPERNTIANL